ncbi:MAG TPA: alanine racemase [Humibacter sp.]|nr:alanine racemase [Humibacter sp.]
MTATLHIDLSAFDRNLSTVRRTVAPAQVMMVVKNDAYAHGTEVLVRRALDQGVQWIGCLDLPTAFQVRARTVAPHVFAWLLATDDDLQRAVAERIDLGIGDPNLLEAVADAAAAEGTTADVHLKIDTGLNRNGVRAEDWPAFVARAHELQNAGRLRVVGIWSHISEASDDDDDLARVRFDEAIGAARSAGLQPEYRHLAASAAGFQRREFDYDLVRVGAFLYGIAPAGGPTAAELGLTPIASLHAHVQSVRDGIAVVPIGSWCGLPSSAAGRVTVSVGGRAYPVRRIGTDWMELAAPHGGLSVGDEAIVFGAGDRGDLTSTQWAEAVDTIGEEVQVRLDPRIARVYL